MVSVSLDCSFELRLGREGILHILIKKISKGILNDDGTLNNDASCLRLAEVAVAYAKAGKYVWFFRLLLIEEAIV